MPSHVCSNSNKCNTVWDKLGCIELYKLSSVQEREEYLKSIRSCIKCGAHFKFDKRNPHKCKWSAEKVQAVMCQDQTGGSQCRKGAAMCLEHKDNASQHLRSWLAQFKLKFFVNHYS